MQRGLRTQEKDQPCGKFGQVFTLVQIENYELAWMLKNLATAFLDSIRAESQKILSSTLHAIEHGQIVCDEYIMHARTRFIGLLRDNERELYPKKMNNVSFPVFWMSL